MRLTKNILILFGSYLGAVLLVTCVGRLTHSVVAPSVDEGGTGDAAALGTVEPDGGEDLFASLTEGIETDRGTSSLAPPSDGGTVSGTDAGASDGTDQQDAPSAGHEVYVVRTVEAEEGGAYEIGVFDESGRLVDVLDTPAFALPARDREALSVGIRVEGREALLDLLESLEG